MFRLLLFILPLGLDTLGVSISLGIKSQRAEVSMSITKKLVFPAWLGSALLFSLAETLMPLVGLVIGYAASLVISNIMHFVGPLLLIGVGLWEVLEEVSERIRKGKKPASVGTNPAVARPENTFHWDSQLLLALSVSLDELAVGFSLGALTSSLANGQAANPLILCILIGLQGFLMTLIGLTLGRTLRARLKSVKDWTELLSGLLLIALGIAISV